ncbi:MAG: hypothetical protein ACOYJS_03665 [Acutalibacteraceae bacterium]
MNKTNFSCFWACATTWGRVQINNNVTTINISGGELYLQAFLIENPEEVTKIVCDGREVLEYTALNNRIIFSKEISICNALTLIK